MLSNLQTCRGHLRVSFQLLFFPSHNFDAHKFIFRENKILNKGFNSSCTQFNVTVDLVTVDDWYKFTSCRHMSLNIEQGSRWGRADALMRRTELLFAAWRSDCARQALSIYHNIQIAQLEISLLYVKMFVGGMNQKAFTCLFINHIHNALV